MSPIPRPSETSLCLNPQLKTDAPRLLHLDATGGEAAATVYPVFPGMELMYRDIHARSCRGERGGPGERRGVSGGEGVAVDEEVRGNREEGQWDGRPESATSGEGDVPTGPPPDFDWEAELAEHPLHHCETCAAPRPDCQKKRRT